MVVCNCYMLLCNVYYRLWTQARGSLCVEVILSDFCICTFISHYGKALPFWGPFCKYTQQLELANLNLGCELYHSVMCAQPAAITALSEPVSLWVQWGLSLSPKGVVRIMHVKCFLGPLATRRSSAQEVVAVTAFYKGYLQPHTVLGMRVMENASSF